MFWNIWTILAVSMAKPLIMESIIREGIEELKTFRISLHPELTGGMFHLLEKCPEFPITSEFDFFHESSNYKECTDFVEEEGTLKSVLKKCRTKTERVARKSGLSLGSVA